MIFYMVMNLTKIIYSSVIIVTVISISYTVGLMNDVNLVIDDRELVKMYDEGYLEICTNTYRYFDRVTSCMVPLDRVTLETTPDGYTFYTDSWCYYFKFPERELLLIYDEHHDGKKTGLCDYPDYDYTFERPMWKGQVIKPLFTDREFFVAHTFNRGK